MNGPVHINKTLQSGKMQVGTETISLPEGFRPV